MIVPLRYVPMAGYLMGNVSMAPVFATRDLLATIGYCVCSTGNCTCSEGYKGPENLMMKLASVMQVTKVKFVLRSNALKT